MAPPTPPPAAALTGSAYRRFVLILGAIAATGPLSIDMYLPSLPAIGREFGATPGAVQLTVTAYFIGLAFGQLIYGPVSDRFGRRRPLLIGLALYTLASLGCALAPDAPSLVAMRVLQALGGCSGMVITRALVRDRFDAQAMARTLSALVLVMGAAPILAPTLGGWIFVAFGWKAIFVVLAAFGALCTLLVATGIREVERERAPPLRLLGIARGYARILGHRRFMGYALAGGCAQSGMFAYITASPFVFIDYFGLKPSDYGLLFGVNATGLILGSQLNARLLRQLRSERVLRAALGFYVVAASLMLAAALSGVGGVWGVAVPLALCIGSLGFVFPNSQAGAMTPFGDRAGMASALLGTLQFTLACIASVVVSRVHTGDAVGMAAAVLSCSLAAQLALRTLVPPAPAVT